MMGFDIKGVFPTDFLITGCNRSGTTLMASIISLSPNAVVLNEHYECNVNVLGNKAVGIKAPMPRMAYNRKMSYGQIQLWRKFHKWSNRILPKQISGVYGESIQDYLRDHRKIIVMHRDMEGNANSIVRATKVSKKKALYEVEYAEQVINKIQENQNVLVVELSELTDQVEKVSKSVCSFLGIAYAEEMLDAYKYNGYRYQGIKSKS